MRENNPEQTISPRNRSSEVWSETSEKRSVAREPKWDASGKNGPVADGAGTRDGDGTLRTHARALNEDGRARRQQIYSDVHHTF